MATVKLKNASAVETSYSAENIKIPLASGTGYAVYTMGVADGYSVIFQNDGSNFAVYSVKAGHSVNAPSNTPSKTGYNYKGWGVSTTATTYITFPYTPTASTTLYAVYKAVRQIALTLSNVAGSSSNVTSAEEGTTVTLTYTANSGYELPDTVSVEGATATWTKSTGTLVLTDLTANVTGSIIGTAVAQTVGTLEETDWATISEISAAGTAADYWEVGDKKSVLINGTIGTQAFNKTLYVFITEFDHNSSVEGSGISFQGFKNASGTDICLCDSQYPNYSNTTTKYFNMNHNASDTNAGGWKSCDLRYDILGSVNSKGTQNAATTTATSPVSNTLMAALPSALRAVMKPITKYTDNTGGGSNTASYVTATVDYLPLLSEFEVHGSRSYANSAEQNYQTQYAYYAAGNSKVKYKDADGTTSAYWWVRSPRYDDSYTFCYVGTGGDAHYNFSSYSCGLAPAFVV